MDNEILPAKLTSVKKAFKNEHNFNQWLCGDEPLAQFSKEINMSLEIIDREVHTATGRTDILCSDTVDNSLVIIEICLDGSDQTHLSRLISYAVELHCEVTVLIAESFSQKTKELVAKINNNKKIDLTIKLVEIKMFKSEENLFCYYNELKKAEIPNPKKFDWAYPEQYKENAFASIEKIYNGIDEVKLNSEIKDIIKKIDISSKLDSQLEYSFIYWPEEDQFNYYFIYLLYKILFYQPTYLIVCIENSLSEQTYANFAYLLVLVKKLTEVKLINLQFLNSTDNYQIETDIYKELEKIPFYLKYKKRYGFWNTLNDFYFNNHKNKYTENEYNNTGPVRYLVRMPYPNVNLVAFYNGPAKRFNIDLRIFDPQEMSADNRYDQLLDKRKQIDEEIKKFDLELEWARNRFFTDNVYVLRFSWKMKIDRNDPYNNLDDAIIVAKKLIEVESILYKYVEKMEEFVW